MNTAMESKPNENPANSSFKILVVDDDEGLLRLVQKSLKRLGHLPDGCLNGAEAMTHIRQSDYDLLLLDYKLPDMTAKELIQEIQNSKGDIPFLVMSGQGNERIAVDFMKFGARDYLVKEYRFPDILPQVVKQTVEQITMERKLAEAERNLSSQETLYKTLIESVPHVIWLGDASGEITFLNEAWYKLTDRIAEQSLGDRWTKALHPSDTTEVLTKWRNAQENGQRFEGQYRLRTRDGGYRTVESICTPVRDNSGQVINWVGISTDITEHKDIEQSLMRQTDELARSNQELEEFAYVASHDLQEPLRKVASFAELLTKRYKNRLDNDANEFINYIIDGATRMQTLIKDLLSYSRVGRAELKLEPTNFEDLLRLVLSNLEVTIKECNIEVTSGSLPVVLANRTQMTQLLQNLIGNAIKYRNDQAPTVHISAEQKKDAWVFSVRDNGIGIDPEFKNRIFVIFQRLHTRDEYRGTGVGLAICKKILQRHGGRIWVKSQVGQGATFFFTLPITNNEGEAHAYRTR